MFIFEYPVNRLWFWLLFVACVAVGLYAIDAQSCEVESVAIDATYRATVETECDDQLIDDATNDVYKFVAYDDGLCQYTAVDFD